jgi:hypothetical protein
MIGAAMQIEELIWLDEVVDKLARKHNVSPDEVRQVFENRPRFRYISKGRRNKDEDVYAAYGQTDDGRYLTVFFIRKLGGAALIVSAREIDDKERKRYGR